MQQSYSMDVLYETARNRLTQIMMARMDGEFDDGQDTTFDALPDGGQSCDLRTFGVDIEQRLLQRFLVVVFLNFEPVADAHEGDEHYQLRGRHGYLQV